MRRELTLVLLAGAAGAGLVVLAVRQAWAHAIFIPPRPLPAQDIAVTGQQLVPLAGALALAALACLAAVIATRALMRRAVGVLLAVLGAGAAVAVMAGLRDSAVLAAARASALDGPLGGSTTSGTSSGGAVHEIVIAGPGQVVLTGAPWRAAAVAGAVVIVLAGLATAWRGPRWPVMSARFQVESQGGAGGMGSSQGGSGGMGPPGRKRKEERKSGGLRGAAPPEDMWESLSRDVDPTVDDGTRT